MQLDLLQKYKDLKFHPPSTLFELDLKIATEKRHCPLCMCRLYEMRNKKMWYCRSKKHKATFVIGSDKLKTQKP